MVRARIEELTNDRKGMVAREVALRQEVSEMTSQLRDAERRADAIDLARQTEVGRVKSLQEEIDDMMRRIEDSRRQAALAEEKAAASRDRERSIEQQAESARRDLERERAARGVTDLRLDQSTAESTRKEERLLAQLEREREGRTAAERRASERSISLQTELQEAQRQTAAERRMNERLRQAAKAAAAAYCLRLLVSRNRHLLMHALQVWLVASLEYAVADRVYTVEERARQQLMLQARTFQVRLEALEHSTVTSP